MNTIGTVHRIYRYTDEHYIGAVHRIYRYTDEHYWCGSHDLQIHRGAL